MIVLLCVGLCCRGASSECGMHSVPNRMCPFGPASAQLLHPRTALTGALASRADTSLAALEKPCLLSFAGPWSRVPAKQRLFLVAPIRQTLAKRTEQEPRHPQPAGTGTHVAQPALHEALAQHIKGLQKPGDGPGRLPDTNVQPGPAQVPSKLRHARVRQAPTAGVVPCTGAATMRGVRAEKPHSSDTRCTEARWRRVTSVAAAGTPARQMPSAARSAAPGRQGNLTNSVRLSAVTALRFSAPQNSGKVLWLLGIVLALQ